MAIQSHWPTRPAWKRLVSFAAINALFVLGHDWRLLAILDSAAFLTFTIAFAASRVWPDRIWIRGSR